MEDLSILQDRIGGFYEIVDLLQWPRTQVHNRLSRERRKSDIWVPGHLPRPVFRIHATPIFDLQQYWEFLYGAGYRDHQHWLGYGVTRFQQHGVMER